MSEEIGLFEAMYSQRALRHLKPDPVPDDLVRKVIEAGTRAPNGGNTPPCRICCSPPARSDWGAC